MCGLLLLGRMYVSVLKQVCQCLPGAVHFPPLLALQLWLFMKGNVPFCVISHPIPTPHPPHACTHTHVCVECCSNSNSAQYFRRHNCTWRFTWWWHGNFNGFHSHLPWLKQLCLLVPSTHSWLLTANGAWFNVLDGSDAKCKVLQYMTPVDNMCVLTLGAEA